MPTTKELYYSNGSYADERKTLHYQVVNEILGDKKPIESEIPYFILIGGGVGTGKPILNRLLQNEGIVDKLHTAIIEPKHFIKILPELNILSNIQHPEKLPEFIDEYYDISKLVIQEAVKRGLSVVYVDHAERPDVIKDIIQEVKEAGQKPYDTQLIMMTSTVDHYLKRIKEREEAGRGEGVNQEQRFAAQHIVLSRIFEKLPELFERSTIMYTQNQVPEIAARYELNLDGTLTKEIINEQYLENYRQTPARIQEKGFKLAAENIATQYNERKLGEGADSRTSRIRANRDTITRVASYKNRDVENSLQNNFASRFLAQKRMDESMQRVS